MFCNVTEDGNPPASKYEWLKSHGMALNTTDAANYSFLITSILDENNTYSCNAVNYLTIPGQSSNDRRNKSINNGHLTVNGIYLNIEISFFARCLV